MKYFPHDCDASEDHRLQDLKDKYGYEGLGFYWHCIERITKEYDYPKNILCLLPDNVSRLARQANTSEDHLIEFLEYFVQIGLFTKTADGQYQNIKVWKRIDRYTRKKLKSEGITITEDMTQEEIAKIAMDRSERKRCAAVSGSAPKVSFSAHSVHTKGTQSAHSVHTKGTQSEQSVQKNESILD